MSTARPRAAIDIDAPLERVWDVMLDTASYAEWNPFVVRVETPAPPAVGNPIVLHVRWANGRGARSPERISALEPPAVVDGVTTARLSYAYEGLPARLRLVRGVRHQVLTQSPGGPTRYDTVEEFTGPLVPLAGPARVADGFRRHAEGLKARAEALAATGG
ncbi:SRPBCC domain-containing protein [Nocardioides sp. SYSU D00038]|uniref:SRPBCC domain-containing protein n=1 Tax=Nocardioides sp. SYSU D00038 TaxID=2812554 RepID=UPI001967948E|nr:SRPBCC domain-containing protein [Nocardioides sp. SYSU D00038]